MGYIHDTSVHMLGVPENIHLKFPSQTMVIPHILGTRDINMKILLLLVSITVFRFAENIFKIY
jgi:hypothetical protein